MIEESIPVGISLPKMVISKIDSERRDVSRSRYILRLIQRAYSIDSLTKPQKISQAESRDGASNQPAISDIKQPWEGGFIS